MLYQHQPAPCKQNNQQHVTTLTKDQKTLTNNMAESECIQWHKTFTKDGIYVSVHTQECSF